MPMIAVQIPEDSPTSDNEEDLCDRFPEAL